MTDGDTQTAAPAAERKPVRLPPPPAVAKGSRAGGERLPMLDVVLERLAKTLQAGLRRLAGDGISVSVETPQNLRLAEYLQKLPSPTLLCISRIEGSNSPGLVVAGADLVYSTIELFLGGQPLPVEARPNRPFSAVERSLAERMVRIVLADLATAFQPVAEMKLRLDRVETLPKFAAVVRETNVVLVITLRLQMGGLGGSLDIVLPHSSIEPLRDALRQTNPGERLGRDPLWEQHLTQELLTSSLRLSAILDEPMVSLGQMMGWRVGSTLALGATPDTPVRIACGKTPMFVGSMGRHDDRMVVRIDGRMDA